MVIINNKKESESMSKLYRISADSSGVFKLRLAEYEVGEHLWWMPKDDDELDKLVSNVNRFNIFTRDINRIDEHKLIMLRKFEEYYKGEKDRVDKSLSVIAEHKVGLS